MASMIVLNSKSKCSVTGFCVSKAVAMAGAPGATVFESDLVLRSALFVVRSTVRETAYNIFFSSCCALNVDLGFNSLAIKGTAPRGHQDGSCPIEYERTNSHVQFTASPQ